MPTLKRIALAFAMVITLTAVAGVITATASAHIGAGNTPILDASNITTDGVTKSHNACPAGNAWPYNSCLAQQMTITWATYCQTHACPLGTSGRSLPLTIPAGKGINYSFFLTEGGALHCPEALARAKQRGAFCR
jgi:hypothetical protein